MDRQYLLEGPSGKLWNVYIDENMHLVYSKEEEGSWSDPTPLDKLYIRDFSCTIDSNDKVHIVAYSTKRQLIYYQWNGEKWLYSIMDTLRSQSQDVSFAQVISHREHVHILYYLENSLYRNRNPFYHYYGDGFHWKGGRAFTFSPEENVYISNISCQDNDRISLYYSKIYNGKTTVNKTEFNSQSYIWSDPQPAFDLSIYLDTPRVYIDRNGQEHLIGTHIQGNTHTLYYIFHNGAQIPISSQSKPFGSPIMSFADNDIYVTWAADGKIFKSILNEKNNSFHMLREVHMDSMSPVDHVTVGENGISYLESNWNDISFSRSMNDEANPYYYPQADELEILQRDVNSIRNTLANFQHQLEDLYSLYSSLKDHILHYEKVIYQIQLAMKRHDNEIARIHNIPKKNRSQAQLNYSIQVPEGAEDEGEHEREIVSLGDTQIIIDNEEDESVDS